LNFAQHRAELEPLTMGDRFRHIFRENIWGSPETASGVGSTIDATRAIREGIESVCAAYSVESLLDAPCGDFGWMSSLKLPVREYLGVDIVPELIERNNRQYSTEHRRFQLADLTVDPLPAFDLVLCRDCLVHLSFENIARVIANFARSGSKYLLTTTFPDHDANIDIQDGDWRLLNLQKPPFSFPEPLTLINEECDEVDGAYNDKSLALWRLDSLVLDLDI
jgi:hypothetical protein